MVEPFIDAMSESSYIPWIKVGIVSWIVLAHYTMPTWRYPSSNSNHEEDNYNMKHTPDMAQSQQGRITTPATSIQQHAPSLTMEHIDTMSERAANYRRLQRVQEIAATDKRRSNSIFSNASNSRSLDFGRFKRDLERRQTFDAPALSLLQREHSANNMDNHGLLRDTTSQQSNLNATTAERFARPLAVSRPSSLYVRSNQSFMADHPPADYRFSVSASRPSRASSFATAESMTATSNSILMADNPFQISDSTTGQQPIPEFARKISAESSSTIPRDSSRSNEYEFQQFNGKGRKRPLSAIFADSIVGHEKPRVPSSSTVAARTKSTRQLAGIIRPRVKVSVSPGALEDMSGSDVAQKTKRLRKTAHTDLDDTRQETSNSGFKVPEDRTQRQDRQQNLEELQRNPSKQTRKANEISAGNSTSPMKQPLVFSRPRPPGKHRIIPISQNASDSRARSQSGTRRAAENEQLHALKEEIGEGSRSRSEVPATSAIFDQRTRNVERWMKERNPTMLSPPLTSSSETMQRSPTDDGQDYDSATVPSVLTRRSSNLQPQQNQQEQQQQQYRANKRKAVNQLRRMDPKRHHLEPPSSSRSAPQLSDTLPSRTANNTSSSYSPSSHYQLHSHAQRKQQSEEVAGLRDQQDPDATALPAVDWSRFQSKYGVQSPRKKETLARTTSALGSLTRTQSLKSSSPSPYAYRALSITPSKIKRFNSSLGAGGDHRQHHPSEPALSPLIRLRQSQLKRRQQEDFLGLRRERAPIRAAHGNDGDDGENENEYADEEALEAAASLQFNQVLETWEREDDETLVRNATLEAEALEAKGLKVNWDNDDDDGDGDGDEQEEPDKKEDWHVPLGPPQASLHRVITHPGESSRRPVPDFQPKKKTTTTTTTPTQQLQHKSPGGSTSSSSAPPAAAAAAAPSLATFDFRSTLRGNNKGSNGLTYSRSTPGSAERRRQQHPGLFTPSKKKSGSSGASPYMASPTLSRYTQLTLHQTDEEDE
ncbi:hypothetical protein BG004_004366 [Podila humilis]|nr:hypothetical protein BG004_004366 [Podila humilis]